MIKTTLLALLVVAMMIVGFSPDARADGSDFGVNTTFSSSAGADSASRPRPKPVPEPSSLLLLATGVAGLVVAKVRSRKNRDNSARN